MASEPTQPTACTLSPQGQGEDFRTTRWTQVSRAKVDSPEGRRALTELCAAYYEPVAAFLRCELRETDAARELAHDFFAVMLAGGTIAHASQERGRFRSYLLGAVKHFLSHHREAVGRLKRGGGLEKISLDQTDTGEARTVADASVLSPDAAFDRQWALTVVARALEALRAECATEGRAVFFEQVKPWLTGDAARGDQTALAADCGMNANALKVAVSRLKRRFRILLKAEVAGTLDDPGLIAAEMRELFDALGT
ncbi:MAG TPA: sigma-70 family RNA polymerase sigma factor [Verrucomicrobiae bacterium]|nr:sigma-70 family RNA polymerase sigma factor [Verrucomicrobiae bacterium]